MLRLLTAGESHGPACVAIIEGMPAGVAVSVNDINQELKRRHSDFGRGGRALIEKDEAEILAGVRYGVLFVKSNNLLKIFYSVSPPVPCVGFGNMAEGTQPGRIIVLCQGGYSHLDI